MFDIGFMEILVIGVVSLVVIGPERLPEVAAKVGKTVAKLRRFVQGVRSDITRELEAGDLKKLIGDQKDQIDELRKVVHAATNDIQKSTSDALKDAESSIKEISADVTDDELNATEIAEDEQHIAELESDAAQRERSKLADDAVDVSENKAS